MKSNREITAKRRAIVSSLRLRGMTLDQITEAVQGQRGLVNPRTGRPFGRSTVYKDLNALVADWEAEAAANTASLRAQQLAELREARKAAWKARDLGEVRQLLKLEMQLLGTDAPERTLALNANVDVTALSDDELRAIIEG